MKFTSSSAAAVALAFALGASAEGASDVLDLTASTFKSLVDPESLMLVEFFAPWCGHCKALAPEYEEAATFLKTKDIKLAKVDCTEQADLCQDHGVQGYPTLKVFRSGDSTPYAGPRKADGIISYMVKQSLPAVSEVTTANLIEFQNADRMVAIAYLKNEEADPAPEFFKLGEKHRDDYLFGLSTDPDAAANAAVTPPAVVLYRKFDERDTVYPYPIASATVEDFEQWIADLSIPTLDEVSGENYNMYASSLKPLAYLFVDPSLPAHKDQIELLRPVAKEFKNKVNFVWIDGIKFGDHAKALNLPEPKWPAFVIQDLTKSLKYPMDQEIAIETASLRELVSSYVSGDLKPSLKSAAIPESQDESVYTLVGKEFDQVVFDDAKDVFVEFYATWCGHCKRLKPIWDTLGDKFADVKDQITIAKMEATENDIPPSAGFSVSGFPTIKFKAAGTKSFIDYDGDRSLESLEAFVRENAKNSLKPSAAPAAENLTTAEQIAQAIVGESKGHDEL